MADHRRPRDGCAAGGAARASAGRTRQGGRAGRHGRLGRRDLPRHRPRQPADLPRLRRHGQHLVIRNATSSRSLPPPPTNPAPEPARPRFARAPGSARPLVHRPDDKPKIANARLMASTSGADYARIIRLATQDRVAAHAASLPTIPGTNEPAIRGGKRRHEPEPTPKRESARTISREHVRTRAAESMCTDELPADKTNPSAPGSDPNPCQVLHERTHRRARPNPRAGRTLEKLRNEPKPLAKSATGAEPLSWSA